MIYYLYEIKNTVNGKIYVGVHKTCDVNDGYMGSGKALMLAYEKYGRDKFTKTILEYFNSSEDMFAREKEVVTEEFISRKDTYNMRRGGRGGFDHINNSRIPKFKGKQHSGDLTRFGHVGNAAFAGKTHTQEVRERIAKALTGRKRSPESIARQKEVWKKKKEQAGKVFTDTCESSKLE